jgi:WD40 repeat protein/serine/threonine protein kinase
MRASTGLESGSAAESHSVASRVWANGVREPDRLMEGPGMTIGRYKLLQQIGEGGFGLVYMAEQEEPVQRKVALKIIKAGMDTREIIARFEAERQALALMDHPNIARVLDGGATQTGRPYFVMELVRGIAITVYCDQASLSPRERLELFTKVCRAVQHAHQKGVIHRDLKPSNVLVTLHDGEPVPKVIDFGVAKALDQKLTKRSLFTRFEQMLGTPAYMSPEQTALGGLDIDTRSDVYSLGVLLYELLTGVTPLDEETLRKGEMDEIRQMIRETDPPKPSTRLLSLGDRLAEVAKHRRAEPGVLNRLIRGDLDWITMKALEKDRRRRYETVNGLARDIERHLRDEPVVARPPSTAYKVRKFIRRNKLTVAAATVVATVFVLGVLVSTGQAIRATRAERTQIRLRQAAETADVRESQQRERAEAGESSARKSLYAADMNLAQQAWEQSNVRRVREVLEETGTYPERGFEWYYWQRQTHLDQRTFRGHSEFIWCVAFSPDGRRILTGSRDRTAKLWDAASGGEILTLQGQASQVRSVAFSPNSQRIVTGREDKTARVWDAAGGKELLTLQGHRKRIMAVVFSPDGKRIVTGSADKTAKVWEAFSGQELLSLQGHSGRIDSVAFSGDNRRIATGSADKSAKVWDAANGKELLALLGHSAEVRTVAFSPDSQRIVTGSDDQTVKVWDAATGQELLTLRGHRDRVTSVAYSPDGQRIVTGSLDQTAKLWDAKSAKELQTFKGHSAGIYGVAFSPDGQRIVTSSADQTAKLWKAAGAEQLLRLEGAGLWAMVFSPDGRSIITPGSDDTARVWEVAGGKERLTLRGHRGRIRSAAISPDGHRIVTGSEDHTAKVWDAASGIELLTLKGHSGRLTSVAFAADGQRIITASEDQTARVWDAASGKESVALRGHTDQIVSVACSPDGRRIVTGAADQTAKVWDAASGKEQLTLSGHSAVVRCVSFSPDGQRVVTGSEDGATKIWDAASGRELLTLSGHSAAVRCVSFSPDGQRLATGGEDQAAKVWDVASGKELLALKLHSAQIWSLAFSPDGQRLVGGGQEQAIQLWDVATAQNVTAWREEEKEAADRQTVLRREQAAAAEHNRALREQDPGTIKQWLVLAPIAFEGRNGEVASAVEQVPQEAHLRPRAGERVKLGQGEVVWRAVQLKDFVIDFNQLLGEITEWSVAYAVCYIQSENAQSGLQMVVGSDDEAKIYLNGKEIYWNAQARVFMPDEDVVRGVELKAGLNVLVLKVVNEMGKWYGSVRFSDSADHAVKGISVTLNGHPPL